MCLQYFVEILAETRFSATSFLSVVMPQQRIVLTFAHGQRYQEILRCIISRAIASQVDLRTPPWLSVSEQLKDGCLTRLERVRFSPERLLLATLTCICPFSVESFDAVIYVYETLITL